MLLAIDVGNTQTVLGLYDGETLRDHWRVATESHRRGDELGALLEALVPALDEIDGVSLSSTVPALVRSYEDFVARFTSAKLLVLGPGLRTGVPVRADHLSYRRLVKSAASFARGEGRIVYPVAERRRRVTLPFFAARSLLLFADDPTAIGTMSGTSTGSAPHPPPCFGCLYT